MRRHKSEQELEADLKKQANVPRSTPASDWAKVQLQTRVALAERRQQNVVATSLRQEDFNAVLRLPKELRQDRWQELGGLYAFHSSNPALPSSPLSALLSTCRYGWSKRPLSARSNESARSSREGRSDLPEKMLLPLPRQLSRLTDEQMLQLWETVTAPQPIGEIVYSSSALGSISLLLQSPSNRVHTLDLSGVSLCGLDPSGKPKLNGEYRADGVDLLCEAIRSEHCMLKVLPPSFRGLP